jgi:thermitase
VLAVAATDNRDALAGFSNFGVRSVHVAAPGVKVFSTSKNGGYESLSGTSMATPHVAGIAALLLSADSTLTPTQVKERLIRSSDPVRGLARKVQARGRVNAERAFLNLESPPAGPIDSQWRVVDRLIESDHPYGNAKNQTFEVVVPGAKYLRVVFEKIDVEKNYDKITIESPSEGALEVLTGKLENHVSEYVEGEKLVIRLTSDSSIDGFGFKIDRIQVVE